MEILKDYRKRIDDIDVQLIDLLRTRYDVIEEVMVIKQRDGIDAVLQDRVDEVRENAATLAEAKGMDAEFIRSIWAQLIAHSCEVEEKFICAEAQKKDTGS